MHEDNKKCIQHLDGKPEGNRQLERPRHGPGVGWGQCYNLMLKKKGVRVCNGFS